MDKEINIDWTLIAESLGGDVDAIEKAKYLAETDPTFKSVLSEATEIWNQSISLGQEKKRQLNASHLENKVNEIWSKILEVESEETKIATTLESNTNGVNDDVLDIWKASESLGAKSKRKVSSDEMDAAMAKMLLRMNVSAEEKKENKPTFKVEKPVAAQTKERAMTFPRNIAAAVAVLLAVGLSMFFYLQNGSADMLEMSTSDATAMVTLPDGTQVWLNKNSTLQYPKSFGEGDRNVTLKGDAFFEVFRDEAHPFHIMTDEATTTVLGTSFHLTANKVEVVTGKVRFENNNSGEYVVLVKNEKGAIAEGKVEKSSYSDVNAASLMQSELAFNSADLAETVKVISKAYNTSIEIASPELEQRKFTGLFKNKSFDTVIAQLTEVVGCSIETKEDGTVVLK